MELVNKVLAATNLPTDLADPVSGFQDLGDVFGFAINLLIGIGWGMVFIFITLGFMQYITSKGEKTATQNAQQWLTYAVIGGIGLFLVGFLRRILPTMLTGNNSAPVDIGF